MKIHQVLLELLLVATLPISPVTIQAAGFRQPVPTRSTPEDQSLNLDVCEKLVREDWLRQWQSRENPDRPVTTSGDASGACDGVKDGKYGFHTGQEPNPWWQVDLGQTSTVARIVVFNRMDYAPGLHNADHIRILSSTDGRQWSLRHEQAGLHFGGISGAKPLEVSFPQPLETRFVRLQIPSPQPIFLHLDEVEVYGREGSNLALNRPADQSSLSPWSVNKKRPRSDSQRTFPIPEYLARGRRLAADLQQSGLDCQVHLKALDSVDKHYTQLGAKADVTALENLYLDLRQVIRRMALANPVLNFNRLLFVKRFTQETYPDVCLNHMPWVSRPGGDLAILDSSPGKPLFSALADFKETRNSQPEGNPSPTLRHLLHGALGPGHVHGMDLRFDASRIVFGFAMAKTSQPPDGWLDRSQSYRLRRTEEPIHIFEIGMDGQNLRQLTSSEWSDLDPTYAPNGDIVFVSERCGTSLQCNEYDKDETSCNLYVMKPDGSQIRRLSVNKDGDYLPHTLDDGTIAYTRWEYHERSWAYIQSIWTIRPDGTGADAVFKQHFVNPWALEETRSVPGSRQLVAVAAGHHTLPVGPIVLVDTMAGINNPQGMTIVTPNVKPPEGGMDGLPVPEGGVLDGGGFYSHPWPLSSKYFLVCYNYGKETDATGYGLYLIDVFGNKELLYRDPAVSCFMPVPLRPRARPPVFPDAFDPASEQATCVVSDARFGSEDLSRDQVRYLRISEPIGWPYDNTLGGQRYGEDHGYGGPDAERKNLLNWTPVRILGDVPVEADGSAHFKVPADTAVYFQLLDENRQELRRMRSFISFQPGEVRACVGCHESRPGTMHPAAKSAAANRSPSPPIPAPWGSLPVNFLRDIQPVLDQHCVSCHQGLKPAGNLDFSGGLTCIDPKIPGYGHNLAFETIIKSNLVSRSRVRDQDASITPPLAYGSHKSRLIACLSDKTHAGRVKLPREDRLRLTMWIDANAPYHDQFVNKRAGQKAYDLAADEGLLRQISEVHQRRCAPCHNTGDVSRLSWINLQKPAQSLFLSAPLAREAGGRGNCRTTVYASSQDADYRLLYDSLEAAVQKAWAYPRRDLASLAANPPKTALAE